jgi:hypothetical protein
LGKKPLGGVGSEYHLLWFHYSARTTRRPVTGDLWRTCRSIKVMGHYSPRRPWGDLQRARGDDSVFAVEANAKKLASRARLGYILRWLEKQNGNSGQGELAENQTQNALVRRCATLNVSTFALAWALAARGMGACGIQVCRSVAEKRRIVELTLTLDQRRKWIGQGKRYTIG